MVEDHDILPDLGNTSLGKTDGVITLDGHRIPFSVYRSDTYSFREIGIGVFLAIAEIAHQGSLHSNVDTTGVGSYMTYIPGFSYREVLIGQKITHFPGIIDA